MARIGTTGNSFCLFGLTTKALLGLDCNGAIQHEWTLVDKPVGSATTVANPMAQNASWLPDIPGDYTFQYCCLFDTEDELPADYVLPDSTPQLA